MKYPEAVKKLRLSLLMTQVEFAEMLDVSFAAVNRWETGKSKPTKRAVYTFELYCKEKNIKFKEED